MTLPRGQRAVIAAFQTMDQAQQAKKALQQSGFEKISIERGGEHPPEQYERHPQHTISGEFPGLANAIFDTDMNRDLSVLNSADPSSSGMNDKGDDNLGLDVVLTLVIQEERFDEVKGIILQHNGNM